MAQPAGAGGGRGRDLRMSIEEVAKKLSLWHTATFRPILTHDELEPILAAAGFVPLPPAPAPRQQQQQECLPTAHAAAAGAVAWREYAFLGCNANAAAAARRRRRPGPRPRLPHPRLDGLHLKTYEAFLGAVEAHLGADRVSNLFHVRLMPVTNPHDRAFDKVFRPMRNFSAEEDGLIVYREGTLDDLTFEMCSRHGAVGDLGHHVIPGVSCADLGYLRKVDGNCHQEGCCARHPASGAAAATGGGYDFFAVHLKDLLPKY
ncbi:hypothetical protein GQ55_6G250900 [Panicum hallii var. hallii]|uniref:Uncharacterized protein n=1 Tax=Panicum hallii var. hallii TaxID=1504633 RepID=A0A2T7D9C8_9POAL|nr:hypothetical protein GQ55_6G250900 [Panicum hallii var. hallii]